MSSIVSISFITFLIFLVFNTFFTGLIIISIILSDSSLFSRSFITVITYSMAIISLIMIGTYPSTWTTYKRSLTISTAFGSGAQTLCPNSSRIFVTFKGIYLSAYIAIFSSIMYLPDSALDSHFLAIIRSSIQIPSVLEYFCSFSCIKTMALPIDLFNPVLYKLISHPYVFWLLTILKNLSIYNPKNKAASSFFYTLL